MRASGATASSHAAYASRQGHHITRTKGRRCRLHAALALWSTASNEPASKFSSKIQLWLKAPASC